MNELTIFGWTLGQWRKAFDYLNVPDVDSLLMTAATSVPSRDGARDPKDTEAFRKLAEVKRDWLMKRDDDDDDADDADTIIPADTYRTRKDPSNA